MIIDFPQVELIKKSFVQKFRLDPFICLSCDGCLLAMWHPVYQVHTFHIAVLIGGAWRLFFGSDSYGSDCHRWVSGQSHPSRWAVSPGVAPNKLPNLRNCNSSTLVLPCLPRGAGIINNIFHPASASYVHVTADAWQRGSERRSFTHPLELAIQVERKQCYVADHFGIA